jgi:MoaA/NifB/PqqE/SkfB family radical SAM enzyme
MKSYIDQSVEAYPQSMVVLVLTGGECFLLGNKLEQIIEYATNKGLRVRVVTNGYWAKTYEIAKKKLQ